MPLARTPLIWLQIGRWVALLAVLVSDVGCSSPTFSDAAALNRYLEVASEIEDPTVETVDDPSTVLSSPPFTNDNPQPSDYWELPLEDAIRIALSNSNVLRNVGGAVLRSPQSEPTRYGPAIRESDPRFGIESALSYFDAQVNSTSFLQKNNRGQNNNLILGGGNASLQQDLAGLNWQISKRTATGTIFALGSHNNYDENNYVTNQFKAAWTVDLEAQFRQPLLQGAGVQYGQIVGNGILGFPNGVLIARVNTDVALADFEIAVRDLVSNVENAYWDLYFAYRNLQARVVARDAGLATWQRIDALRRGGQRSASDEAQARTQYFRFQRDVETALAGRPERGTSTNNNSEGGGTFSSNGGVFAAERRLRLLMGLVATDGRLIRPSDEPSTVEVIFDFDQLVQQALTRRAELRQQRWRIKRRELELIASRQYLLPRLDAVGLYRWNGFGKDLINAHRKPDLFDNAYQNLTTGDFQEWYAGFELNFPVGYRQAHVGVRNAELQLAQERAIANEQERQVVHGVSNSLSELNRAYTVAKTSYDVYLAGIDELKAIEKAYEFGSTTTNVLLDAQRRLADAAIEYHRSLVEYSLAVKNVHFEKGTLLEYNNVLLSEGPWPELAYQEAANLEQRRGLPRPLMRAFERVPPVSRGAVWQNYVPPPSDLPLETITPPMPDGAEWPPVGPAAAPGLPPTPTAPTETRATGNLPIPVSIPSSQDVQDTKAAPLPTLPAEDAADMFHVRGGTLWQSGLK